MDPNAFTTSDHLPVRLSVQGFDITSWNILFEAYRQRNPNHMAFFPNMIQDHPQRIATQIQQIRQFIANGTRILCFQEASEFFANELWRAIGGINSDWVFVYPWQITSYNQTAPGRGSDFVMVVYNRRHYQHDLTRSHVAHYVTNNGRNAKCIMNLSMSTVADPNDEFRLINTHVPMNGLPELQTYIDGIRKPRNQNIINVYVCGDFNTVQRLTDYANVDDPNLNPTHRNTRNVPVKYDWIYHIVKH